ELVGHNVALNKRDPRLRNAPSLGPREHVTVVVYGQHLLAAKCELSRQKTLAATYVERTPATGWDRPQHQVVVMNVVIPGGAHGPFIMHGSLLFPISWGMNPYKSFRIRDHRKGPPIGAVRAVRDRTEQ